MAIPVSSSVQMWSSLRHHTPQNKFRSSCNAAWRLRLWNLYCHHTQRIHVWYIYLRLVDVYRNCSQTYHTWILWDMKYTLKRTLKKWWNYIQTLTTTPSRRIPIKTKASTWRKSRCSTFWGASSHVRKETNSAKPQSRVLLLRGFRRRPERRKQPSTNTRN